MAPGPRRRNSHWKPIHGLRQVASAGCIETAQGPLGEPAVEAFLRSRHEPIVLVYHNITPPEYFLGVHKDLVKLCFRGRRELTAYIERCDLALGDSEYNRRELEADRRDIVTAGAILRKKVVAGPYPIGQERGRAWRKAEIVWVTVSLVSPVRSARF